ncbi:MAG TPA: DUF1254 domain-containing protein [Pararhizobium sp.]|nr:DUF1254 domain-containing protein [Pararhizobium sp.]
MKRPFMRALAGLVSAIAVGVVGAAILHIVIVLSIPDYSTHDAWTKVVSLGAPNEFHLLEGAPKENVVYDADPFLRTAICVFHDTAGPIHITAGPPLPFWSLAVFDPQSNEIYSMTDRSAIERRVDVTLATQLQMIALRRAKPDALDKSILIELPGPEGYVVLRTVAEDKTWEPLARRFLQGADCAPVAGS